MSDFRIVLASASPRRAELLAGLGLAVEAVPSGLEETAVDGERPEQMVARLAAEKGRHVGATLRDRNGLVAVLAADTAVVLDEHVLGKPRDRAEAESMLRILSGRTHRVVTGVWLGRSDDGRSAAAVEVTRVRFRSLDRATLEWYVGTGEPLDKAGAYGIQGLGVFLTESVSGSWTNVVGLPLERLPALFGEIGLDLLGATRSARRNVSPR